MNYEKLIQWYEEEKEKIEEEFACNRLSRYEYNQKMQEVEAKYEALYETELDKKWGQK